MEGEKNGEKVTKLQWWPLRGRLQGIGGGGVPFPIFSNVFSDPVLLLQPKG